MAGCAATAAHLRPVGNAAPPRPTSFDAVTSSITRCGPIAQRLAQAAVAAACAVGVERGRVDAADAGQQPQRRVAGLGDELAGVDDVGRECRATGGPSSSMLERRRRRPRRPPRTWVRAPDRRGDEHRRGALALPEAGAAEPGRVARRPAVAPAGPSRASSSSQIRSAPASRQAMSSQTWATIGGRGRRRQQRVERGDAVRLGGRDARAARDVVERARG